MTTPHLTRRRLLAGLGATGLVAGGPFAVRSLAGDHRQYVRYTYAQADGNASRLRVAWYATYRGAAVAGEGDPTSTDGYLPGATGPTVVVDGVLPGDWGTLVVGLLGEADYTVWLRVLVEERENGLTEPEAAAGDVTATGDLAGALAVTVFHDDGLAGIGACNGVRDGLAGDAEARVLGGSLDGLAGVDRYDGAPSTGLSLSFGGDGCLPAGSSRCVSLAWSLGGDARTQTDAASVTVAFAAVECGSDATPWEVSA
jgi:hypothetical protein